MTYHHGDLRAAVLRAAAVAVERDGPHAVNLRALARDVGVSHTAPRHHFGDKRGVLTALATQGYAELAGRLEAAGAEGGFLEVGVAFVGFALERRAHFQVMFRPDLVDVEDPELGRARARLSAQLAGGARQFTSAAPSDPGPGQAGGQFTSAAPRDSEPALRREAHPGAAHDQLRPHQPAEAASPLDVASSSGAFTSAGLAAWSMAHGFATLALSGALAPAPGEDLLDLARSTLSHLSPE